MKKLKASNSNNQKKKNTKKQSFFDSIVDVVYRGIALTQVMFTVRGVAYGYLIPFISALTVVFTFFFNNTQDLSRPMQIPVLVIAGLAILLVPLKTLWDINKRYIDLRDYPYEVEYSEDYFNQLMQKTILNDKYIESGYELLSFRNESSDVGNIEYFVMSNQVNNELWTAESIPFKNYKRRVLFMLSIKPKYKIVNEIYDLRPHVLFHAFEKAEEKGQRLYNQKKIRLNTDLYLDNLIKYDSSKKSKKHKPLEIQKTDYFNYLCSNELAGYQIQSKYAIDAIFDGSRLILTQDKKTMSHSSPMINTVTASIIRNSGGHPVSTSLNIKPVMENSVLNSKTRNSRFDDDSLVLYSLDDSPCSNHLGGSTIAITSDNCLIIGRQERKAYINADLFMPSGSGSFNYSDRKGAIDFRDIIINGLNRELREELNILDPNIKIFTKVVGYARILGTGNHSRGAKPDFFGITFIDYPCKTSADTEGIGDISRKPRITERGFSGKIEIIEFKREDEIGLLLRNFCNKQDDDNISVQLHIFTEIFDYYDNNGINLFKKLKEEYYQNNSD